MFYFQNKSADLRYILPLIENLQKSMSIKKKNMNIEVNETI